MRRSPRRTRASTVWDRRSGRRISRKRARRPSCSRPDTRGSTTSRSHTTSCPLAARSNPASARSTASKASTVTSRRSPWCSRIDGRRPEDAHRGGRGHGPLPAARGVRGALLPLPRAPRQSWRLRHLRAHRPSGGGARAPRPDRSRRDQQALARGHRKAQELQASRHAGKAGVALTKSPAHFDERRNVRAAAFAAALFMLTSTQDPGCTWMFPYCLLPSNAPSVKVGGGFVTHVGSRSTVATAGGPASLSVGGVPEGFCPGGLPLSKKPK